MSTVHKHFPITSRPGGSWGQGATGGLNPLWEEQEKKKRQRGGFKESNKQFEWKISTSSHVQTLVFALEMPPSLVPDGGADSRLPVPTAPPAHASVIMVTMDRGSFGSHCNRRCQAFQARLLITPSGREKSQSRAPSWINEGQQWVPPTGVLSDMLLLVFAH